MRLSRPDRIGSDQIGSERIGQTETASPKSPVPMAFMLPFARFAESNMLVRRLRKLSTRWNTHRNIWNSFDATADNDKASLLKHSYKYQDFTDKHPFLNVSK